MKKRVQVALPEEVCDAVEALVKEANQNFESGSISFSDVITEMVLTSKVDIKSLQAKHTDLRRTLRIMSAKEDLDIDGAIKHLTELKAKAGKRQFRSVATSEENEQ